jgi:GR25 family glycosyltransferase involved in LPS biosynthesis
MFATAMIVYEKSQKRVDNYNEIKKIIPELILFPAIDSINHYDKYRDYSLKMNYITTEYINKTTNLKGKIGCNISHIELLKHCMNLKDDWFLILEDDTSLLDYRSDTIDFLIDSANSNNSHYIQLYTHNKFIKEQKKTKSIKPNLYTMLPQWGTLLH